MPKNLCKTVPVNKMVFLSVLNLKKSSIRKLGLEESIQCSEKTIRRELNKGGMRPQYLDRIARYLDVDSRLLTGELLKKRIGKYERLPQNFIDVRISEMINAYPYVSEEQERLLREGISETLKRILSLYEVSYTQFDSKCFEEQYQFQKELFEAIMPVIDRHFENDGYGNADYDTKKRILQELETYKEEYYGRLYADKVLREEFLKNPPKGYSREKIKRMSADDIIRLQMDLLTEEESEELDPLAIKYGI